ncbi:MAG: mechanosensitive ion channel family protein [Nitrospirae bacterium]|nr:mechanosensitive ion channel family protein [Nitrospirota bacterium]MBF0540932.1 mechanosensitive ion channel family protein [Nitrospirota bacterium]
MILNDVVYGSVTVFNILSAIFTLIVLIIASRVLSLYVKRNLKDKLDKFHLNILNKTINYGLIFIGLFSILSTLGINLSGIMVAGGVTGVVIAFASQRMVGNIISGIFLILERPIKIGEQVSIDNVFGTIEDITFLSTIIITLEGLYVRIPNEKVFTSNISNYNYNKVRRFEFIVGIKYSNDTQKAINIIKETIDNHPMALVNPAPKVNLNEIGKDFVNILAQVWGGNSEWSKVKTELIWEIKNSLEDAGIDLPAPIRMS